MEETKNVKRKDLHQLKSGLAAIMGYIQLAQQKTENLANEDAKKIEEMLSKAIEASRSLETQIRKLEGIDEPLMDL